MRAINIASVISAAKSVIGGRKIALLPDGEIIKSVVTKFAIFGKIMLVGKLPGRVYGGYTESD